MTTINELFAQHGFTLAGGMWGDAQWKQLAPDLVVSVGQAYDWEESEHVSDDDIEALAAPDSMTRRCAIFIYRGKFYDGWKIEHGEAPLYDLPGEASSRVVVADVTSAIEYCASLVVPTPQVVDDFAATCNELANDPRMKKAIASRKARRAKTLKSLR